MSKLSVAAIERGRGEDERDLAARQTSEGDAATAPVMARIRLLMIISGLTTLVAIAAVLTVIGYRVFRTGNNVPPAESVITLPKGARVVANSVAGDSLVITLDVGGATEIRTFDLKTLKETGRVRFVTAP